MVLRMYKKIRFFYRTKLRIVIITAACGGFKILPRLMSRVRIPSPAPITTTPSHSGGCCCICDIDGGFELSGKRVRLQARNGRSMSVSRQASERRDFVFSVRRAGVAGFIFAVGRAGVAGFVLPAMRAKYRGISIVQLLTFLTSFHSGGCC